MPFFPSLARDGGVRRILGRNPGAGRAFIGWLVDSMRVDYSMFCTCSGRSAGKPHGCWVPGIGVLGGYTCGYTGNEGWSRCRLRATDCAMRSAPAAG